MSVPVFEPFAVQLFRRFRAGSTISDLASETGIPQDRIETRLRAACGYLFGPTAGGGSFLSPKLESRRIAELCGERRQSCRFPVNLEIEYRSFHSSGGETQSVGLVRDLSKSGIRFDTVEPLQPGDRLWISLGWPGRQNGSRSAHWMLDGKVVRSEGNSAAVKISRRYLAFGYRSISGEEKRNSSSRLQRASEVATGREDR
jgi:hypothetical protein